MIRDTADRFDKRTIPADSHGDPPFLGWHCARCPNLCYADRM